MKLTHWIIAINTLALVLLTTSWALQPEPARIVTFDVKSTLEKYHTQLIDYGLDGATQREKLAHFDAVMRDTATQYAQDQHLIILVPGAEVAGSEDVTASLQQRILDAMRGRDD